MKLVFGTGMIRSLKSAICFPQPGFHLTRTIFPIFTVDWVLSWKK